MSLRKYLSHDAVQHVGINVDNMEISKNFYGDILGGIFIAEIKGITGEEWTTILNGNVVTAPQLGRGDALDVIVGIGRPATVAAGVVGVAGHELLLAEGLQERIPQLAPVFLLDDGLVAHEVSAQKIRQDAPRP